MMRRLCWCRWCVDVIDLPSLRLFDWYYYDARWCYCHDIFIDHFHVWRAADADAWWCLFRCLCLIFFDAIFFAMPFIAYFATCHAIDIAFIIWWCLFHYFLRWCHAALLMILRHSMPLSHDIVLLIDAIIFFFFRYFSLFTPYAFMLPVCLMPWLRCRRFLLLSLSMIFFLIRCFFFFFRRAYYTDADAVDYYYVTTMREQDARWCAKDDDDMMCADDAIWWSDALILFDADATLMLLTLMLLIFWCWCGKELKELFDDFVFDYFPIYSSMPRRPLDCRLRRCRYADAFYDADLPPLFFTLLRLFFRWCRDTLTMFTRLMSRIVKDTLFVDAARW